MKQKKPLKKTMKANQEKNREKKKIIHAPQLHRLRACTASRCNRRTVTGIYRLPFSVTGFSVLSVSELALGSDALMESAPTPSEGDMGSFAAEDSAAGVSVMATKSKSKCVGDENEGEKG